MNFIYMVRWLRLYGEILSPISEQAHKDSNKDSPVGNGVYMVKMPSKQNDHNKWSNKT